MKVTHSWLDLSYHFLFQEHNGGKRNDVVFKTNPRGKKKIKNLIAEGWSILEVSTCDVYQETSKFKFFCSEKVRNVQESRTRLVRGCLCTAAITSVIVDIIQH